MGRKSRLKRELRAGVRRGPRRRRSRWGRAARFAAWGAAAGLLLCFPIVFPLALAPFHAPRTRSQIVGEALVVVGGVAAAGAVAGVVLALLWPLRRTTGGRTLLGACVGTCVYMVIGFMDAILEQEAPSVGSQVGPLVLGALVGGIAGRFWDRW